MVRPRTEDTFFALDFDRDTPFENLEVFLLVRMKVQRRLLRSDRDHARVVQQEGDLVGEGAMRMRRVGDDASGYAALESARRGRTMIAIFSKMHTSFTNRTQNETHVA
ncbi:hypothetical protein Hte_005981 [Hypoxylon texense]